MAVIIEVVSPLESAGQVDGAATVVEVVNTQTSPVPTSVLTQSAVDVVTPGGTVANVEWGYEFPENPTEGQIFLKVSP